MLTVAYRYQHEREPVVDCAVCDKDVRKHAGIKLKNNIRFVVCTYHKDCLIYAAATLLGRENEGSGKC